MKKLLSALVHLLTGPKFVSVKLFGAKGDGVADDTHAIQMAVDYSTGSGNALLFPPGVYVLNGPLEGD